MDEEAQYVAGDAIVLSMHADGTADVRFAEGPAYPLITPEDARGRQLFVAAAMKIDDGGMDKAFLSTEEFLFVYDAAAKIPRAVCAQLAWERQHGTHTLRPAATRWLADREIKLISMQPSGLHHVSMKLTDDDYKQITAAMGNASSTAPTTEAVELVP